MNKPVQNLIKIVKKNKKFYTFQKQDEKEGVEGVRSSYFLQKYNVIIRGEASEATICTRKRKILLTNLITKELVGKNRN